VGVYGSFGRRRRDERERILREHISIEMTFAAEQERRKVTHSGKYFVSVEQPCGETELAEIVIIVVDDGLSSTSASASTAAAAAEAAGAAGAAAPGVEAEEEAAAAAAAAGEATEERWATPPVSPLKKRPQGKQPEGAAGGAVEGGGANIGAAAGAAGAADAGATAGAGLVVGAGGDGIDDVEVWELGEGSSRGVRRIRGGDDGDDGDNGDDDYRQATGRETTPPSGSTRAAHRGFFPLSPGSVIAFEEEE
jgi:hypothetical protein